LFQERRLSRSNGSSRSPWQESKAQLTSKNRAEGLRIPCFLPTFISLIIHQQLAIDPTSLIFATKEGWMGKKIVNLFYQLIAQRSIEVNISAITRISLICQ
jgi:hypothetical protein